jgi:hypothetical protein
VSDGPVPVTARLQRNQRGDVELAATSSIQSGPSRCQRTKRPERAGRLRGRTEQLLLTLTYWREYRTQFHVALSYGVHETTATRTIGKVEDALIASGRFSSPKKQTLQDPDHEWVMVLSDSTETPIERPNELGRRLPSQKAATLLQW